MNQFTTSRGFEITFKPIPQMLIDRVRTLHKQPEPPFYEVKTVSGAVEKHAHDETTLETDADRAAWAEYQKQIADTNEKTNRAFMRLVFLRGVEIEMPQDDTWAREQKLLGIEIPDDPLERKLHWIETEVVATIADAEHITRGALEASGIPQEALAQADATFRHSPQRDAVEPTPDSSGQVDDDGAVRGGDGRVQDGDGAKPIRRAKRGR